MAFLNSILAGVTLVRESIRSPNYVTGVSGWAIKQDGSAEFNNVTIRGSIAAGSIHIGTDPNSFNVDTTGNMWLGAATLAAANFSVANTGLVKVKSNSGSERMLFVDGSSAPFQWPGIFADPFGAGGSRQLGVTSGKQGALTRSAALSLRSADGTFTSYAQLDATTVDLNSSPSSTLLRITGGSFAFTNGGVTMSSTLAVTGAITGASLSVTGNMQANAQCIPATNGGAQWNTATCVLNPGTGTASQSWHPGGVATQLREGNGVAIVYVRNSADTIYDTLQGILVNTSSRRDKQDIEQWPPPAPMGAAMGLMTAPRVSALDKARALKPSTYRWDRARQLTTVRPKPKKGRKKGAPLAPDEFEHVDHECGVDCAGSAEQPCYRVLDWERPTLGLIAEDAYEVCPEICHVGPDGVADGFDAIAVGALVLAAVQELAEQVDSLRLALNVPNRDA